MESIAKKIKKALEINNLNQKEFCERSKRDEGNFSRRLSKDNFKKIEELESIANDFGYDVEINFVDRNTGEKI